MKLNYINEIRRRLDDQKQTGQIHEDSVRYIISLLAQHLESNNLKDQYKALDFYSTFHKHDTLDKKAVPLLVKIEDVINNTTDGSYGDKINNLLNLNLLRENILSILRENTIHSELFTLDPLWNYFLGILFSDIIKLDKCLIKTYSVQCRDNNSPLGSKPFIINKIRFTNANINELDESFVRMFNLSSNSIQFEITTSTNLLIEGLLSYV